MTILFWIITFIIAFFISFFGFYQIIGTIRLNKLRLIGATVFTVILWSSVLIVELIIIIRFFDNYLTPYIIATVLGFLRSCRAGHKYQDVEEAELSGKNRPCKVCSN